MMNALQRCPSLFAALDWFRNQTLIQTGAEAIASLSQQYLLTAVAQMKTDLGDVVSGLICQGLSCQIPAHWEQLQEQVCHSVSKG